MKPKGIYSEVSGTGSERKLLLRDTETKEVLETLLVKPASQQHKNYILSTWVKSYAQAARKMYTSVGPRVCVKLPEECYILGENGVAETRWSDCTVVTNAEGYTVYAWVCAEPGKLWHAYTVPELRKSGIFTALVRELCGEEVQVARLPMGTMPTHWKYNPYLLCKKEKNG